MAVSIGITGGIGSGKSVVSHLLRVMNIPVYISDIASKQLTVCHPDIRAKLSALVGPSVYVGHELNKPLLADYMFGHPDHLQAVNAIIHPRVRDDYRDWACRHAAAPVIALESAILIEAGFAGEVDSIVMVYAPEEVRIARAMQRDHAPRDLVERRVRSQMSDDVKRLRADYVIDNGGTLPLVPQVLSLLNKCSNKQTSC
ncbi:MAG: dephospho-CoA kinase [Prevotellaceae bacterium]|jgi:dephospho-CoA kinase|nr:dephospho-CoA kinase [Prevotellaceae bacterium]